MTDAKICVLCGESCAGQPRIKNEKGQYAHRVCAEKQAAQRDTAPAAAADADDLAHDDALMSDMLGDGLDDGMLDDALLGDLPSEPAGEVGGMQAACPGCGNSLAQGTVVCMSCGFDTRSGKAKKIKVGKVKEPGSGIGAIASGAGAAAATGMGYVLGSLVA